ncbi:MAG: hypothetical protein QOI74_3988, partial [Micromonosporaceae bacterium]|nr:hypothetical protein [Micromonosporaceae bacterium]
MPTPPVPQPGPPGLTPPGPTPRGPMPSGQAPHGPMPSGQTPHRPMPSGQVPRGPVPPQPVRSAAVPTGSAHGAGTPRHPPGDATVPGHRRGRLRARLWSVRTQLLAPILVSMVGLGVLGTAQTTEAIANARDAARARAVATTATATVRLTHELERELAETVALRQRGGTSGEQLVVAQRRRADQALQRYRAARADAVRTAPALDVQLRAADRQLDRLVAARIASKTGIPAGSQTDPVFHDIANSLLAVADALPAQLRDTDLARAAREISAVAAVEHYLALERDLLRTIYSRGSLQGRDLIDLAQLGTAREQRTAEFTRIASTAARQRYDRTVTGPDVGKATTMRAAVLTGDPAAVKADADGWYVVQSSAI